SDGNTTQVEHLGFTFARFGVGETALWSLRTCGRDCYDCGWLYIDRSGAGFKQKPYVPGRRSPAAGYGAAAILHQLSPPGAVRMLPRRHPARHDRVALAPGEPGRMSTDRPRLSAAPGCGRSAWPDTAPGRPAQWRPARPARWPESGSRPRY